MNLEQTDVVELDIATLENISGGISLGTGAGGIFSPANIATAGRLVTGLGYLGSAFGVGYAIGTFGYQGYNKLRYRTP